MQSVFENQFQLIFVFLTGAFLTLLLTYPISKLAKRFGLVDKPPEFRNDSDTTRNRRIHTKLTVRSGGISIVITFFLLYLIFFNNNLSLGIILGLAILTILGIIDDKYEISGKLQLVIQLIAVFITVLSGVQISIIDKGIPGILTLSPILGIFISVLWIMILINAINWVDGIDGLSSGIVAIAAGTMSILNLQQGNLPVALLSIILAGSVAGYIPWNFPPNKGTFVGGTATIFGFLLGVISILGSTKSAGSILVLLIPIIDMIWVLIGRIHKHEVVNPFKLLQISDKTHLHHRLLDLGLTVRQVTLIEYLFIAIFGIFAIFLSNANKTALVLLLITLCLSIFLGIRIIQHLKKKSKLKK